MNLLASQHYEQNQWELLPRLFPTSHIKKLMTTHFFLVVSRKGAERMTQTLPKLHPGEIAIRINLDVPNALFQAPQIQAAITIPESAVPTEAISAEMRDNVKELIQQATGLEVRLLIEPITPME